MTKTRAQSSSVPDGDERTSAPIFTPALPPRISSTSYAALVKWRKERREYEDTIRNRAKGETDDLIVPIINTFDENLLRLWCRLRWKISIDEVTDSTILTEVDKIISTVKNNSVPDIDQEMANTLRIDLSESDVNERVIQYFRLCLEIIDDHGWRDFFTGDGGRKHLCRILINSLEPKDLREEVDRTARFQTRKARVDEVVLHDLILEKALDHEKAYQSQRRAKRDRGDLDVDRLPPRASNKKLTKKPRVISELSGASPRPPAKSPAERPKVPPNPCPHCDGLHWLSECSRATDSGKAEIRRRLRAQRGDGNKRESARLKRLRKCLPSEEKTVTFNYVIELPYCADTGADRTAISRKHVEELVLRDPSINLTRFTTPEVNVTVAKHEIMSPTSVRLRVLLNTAAGPVALHEPVECQIIEDDEPEFFVGQDLLKVLGIDIDRQLEQLVQRDHDDDDDLTDLADHLPVSSSHSTDDDLRGRIDKLVHDAVDHGKKIICAKTILKVLKCPKYTDVTCGTVSILHSNVLGQLGQRSIYCRTLLYNCMPMSTRV